MIRTFAFIAAFCAGPVMAQDAAVDCTNAMTTYEMRFCANEALRDADEHLNAVYVHAIEYYRENDRYLPEGAPKGEDLLRIAQRAWITYRDAACESEGATSYGGTIQPLIVLSCHEQMTEDRTDALLSLMNEY